MPKSDPLLSQLMLIHPLVMFIDVLYETGKLCVLIASTRHCLGFGTPRSDEIRDRLTFGNPDGLLVVYVGRLGPEKVSPFLPFLRRLVML